MRKILMTGAVLLALNLGPADVAHAGSSGQAALGGALGAAAGVIVGDSIGGRDGAIVGGALGGALGAAAGSSSHHHHRRSGYYAVPARRVYVVPAGRGWGPPHKRWHKHKYKYKGHH